MGIDRPFFRTARQLADGSYQNSGNGRYVRHPLYAPGADKYIHAYLLIQKDMLDVFDYVSGSDVNLRTHSFRIHELIIRACIEVEANFKAILRSNGYSKTGSYTVFDFQKVEPTHYLSGYRVKIPYWHGNQSVRQPFGSFRLASDQATPSPAWYQAYNATKHDRHENFEQANLEVMIDAVAGLAVLLAAQYLTEDYSPVSPGLAASYGDGDGSEDAIGGYFRIFYPDDWPDAERYSFDWQTLKADPNPFSSHNYA